MTYFLDLTAAYVLALVYAGLCVVVAELIVYGPRWPRLTAQFAALPPKAMYWW